MVPRLGQDRGKFRPLQSVTQHQGKRSPVFFPIVMPQTQLSCKSGKVALKTMFWKGKDETRDEVVSWRAPSRPESYRGGTRATPPTHKHKVGSEMLDAVTHEVVNEEDHRDL